MTRRLLGSGADSAGVAVEALVGAPEEGVLRTAFARASGSVWLYRTGFALVGTTPSYGLLKASLLVVQSAVPERQWFESCSVSGRRTFSGYRGYLRFVPVVP